MIREKELYHHGIKGQKWGVRRYNNPDGSLTDRGKKRIAKTKKKAYTIGKLRNRLSKTIHAGREYINDNSLMFQQQLFQQQTLQQQTLQQQLNMINANAVNASLMSSSLSMSGGTNPYMFGSF